MVHLLPNSINRLSKPSGADAFQVRSLSKERFVRKIGAASQEKIIEISSALAVVLSLK
jgi:mRNA interferase MazF